MKSNFPPYFRKFGKELIQDIMFGKSKPEIDKQILDFRENIDTIDWRKLLKPTGLKMMDEYLQRPPQAGAIFSTLRSKCPINTRSAWNTRDLMKFWNLTTKFPTPQIGDKILIAYLKNNPFGINSIALNGYNDPPQLVEFVEKYIDKIHLFDAVLKNKLEKIYEDLGWGGLILNPTINKFFNFGVPKK